MAMGGLDVQQVRQLSSQLNQKATEIENALTQLTNLLGSTTGNTMQVVMARGSAPQYRVTATLQDNQRIEHGRFDFPAPASLALLLVDIEASTNLVTWTRKIQLPAQLIPTTNRSESFRAVLRIEPLNTNFGRVFLPGLILLTNTP